MKKNALILFSGLPFKEAERKRIFLDRNKSKSLAELIFRKTVRTVHRCKENTDFDFVIATDSAKLPAEIAADKVIGFRGGGFAENFVNSMKDVFDLGYESVVVIGDDIPDISSDQIVKSFEILNKDNNAVVGPSADGGFYLFGLKSLEEKLFDGIKWRTKNVFRSLIGNLQGQNYSVYLLRVLADIDDRESLNFWLAIETMAGKLVKKLLMPAASFINLFMLFTVPFIKDDYFSKRISQKSPPLFN